MASVFLFWGGGDRAIKKHGQGNFLHCLSLFMNLGEHTYAEYSDFLYLPIKLKSNYKANLSLARLFNNSCSLCI